MVRLDWKNSDRTWFVFTGRAVWMGCGVFFNFPISRIWVYSQVKFERKVHRALSRGWITSWITGEISMITSCITSWITINLDYEKKLLWIGLSCLKFAGPLREDSLLLTIDLLGVTVTHLSEPGRTKESRPWSHLVVLKVELLDWLSSTLTTRPLPLNSGVPRPRSLCGCVLTSIFHI